MQYPTSRRSVLGGLAAIGASGMLDGTMASAASARPFFRRLRLPLGLQIYTLGDGAGKDLDKTFADVAAIGYREIELPGIYGRPPQEIRAAADRAGLAITSVHLSAIPFTSDPALTFSSANQLIADSLSALGAKYAVLPSPAFSGGPRLKPGEDIYQAFVRMFTEGGADLWKRTAALLNQRAAALKPLGIAVGYHNHNAEFAPIGRTSGWEILARETDPRLVHFEIDVGWVAATGRDPVPLLRALKGRIKQLHVKEVAATNTANFALKMAPTEVGSGTIDWRRVLPAAYAAGARHFYVEQEPPFSIPRIEAARRSYDFLSHLRA